MRGGRVAQTQKANRSAAMNAVISNFDKANCARVSCLIRISITTPYVATTVEKLQV